MQALGPTSVIILLTAYISQEQCARVVEHIGSHSVTKFSVYPHRESAAVLSPIQVLPGMPSEAHCSVSCARHGSCLSFNFKSADQTCELFDDIDPDPSKAIDVTYEVVENRKGIPFDCVETWTAWSSIGLSEMWDYCGLSPSSTLQCTDACAENSTRESMDPAAYGGAACSLTDTRQRNASVCTNQTTGMNHVLLIGGTSTTGRLTTVLDFLPETKQFITLQRGLVQARYVHSAVLYNDQIIVDGGYYDNVLTSVEILGGTPLQQQSTGAYSPQERYGRCTALWNDNLYQCFGRTGSDAYVGDCDVYDLTSNYAHSTLSTQQIPGYGIACVQSHQYLYTIGGYGAAGLYNSFFKVDLSNGTKVDLQVVPSTLHFAGAVWFQGLIVTCGGRAASTLALCHQYNITTNAWTGFPTMTKSRAMFQLANFGTEKLLAIGGYTGEYVTDNTIEMYDKATNNWTYYAQMPYPLEGTAAVVINP